MAESRLATRSSNLRRLCSIGIGCGSRPCLTCKSWPLKTGARVNLGILHKKGLLYLAGVEKPSLPTIYSRFGRTTPAHCCSLGKAILAYLPEPELQVFLTGAELTAQTPQQHLQRRAIHQGA